MAVFHGTGWRTHSGMCILPAVKLCADGSHDTELQDCTNLPTQLTQYVIGAVADKSRRGRTIRTAVRSHLVLWLSNPKLSLSVDKATLGLEIWTSTTTSGLRPPYWKWAEVDWLDFAKSQTTDDIRFVYRQDSVGRGDSTLPHGTPSCHTTTRSVRPLTGADDLTVLMHRLAISSSSIVVLTVF